MHDACIRVIATVFHEIDYDSAYFSTRFLPLILTYMDPDVVRPSVLMRITSLVKDIVYPNRKRVVAPFQPVILKALRRATRNKMMFFDDSAYKSRSQMDKRLTYLKEHGQQHDLNMTASVLIDAEPKTSVTLLFHTECVEILALCCEEVSNHVNPKLSSLLKVETLLAVMTNEQAGSAECPPLMYSYGLFLYRVYLKNSNNSSHSSLQECFSSGMVWKLVELFCKIASAPSSLHNAYRPFIFDVAIPTIECVLKGASTVNNAPGNNVPEYSNISRAGLRKSMQGLLQMMLTLPRTISTLAPGERSVVEDACLYFNVPVLIQNANGADTLPSDGLSTKETPQRVSPKPLADDFLGIYDEEEDEKVFEFEMTTTPKICRMTGQEIKLHTINMLDNCDAIETIRMEISTEHLVAKLMAMANSADGGEADSASSVSSESNSKFSSVPSSDSSFFNTFVKRLTVFSLKAISLVRKEGCQNETYSNLMLVFDIFTVTLRLARQNSQSQILKDLQHLMNSNMAGHLIVEVISLAHSGGVGNTGTLKLVDYALKFSSEFLFNGNRQCQKSLLDLMCGDSSARLNSFFSSIMQSLKCCTEVIRSMIYSRNGIKEVDMGDITASVSSSEQYLDTLARAQATFVLLQSLCEDHYLDMQECFENAELGYVTDRLIGCVREMFICTRHVRVYSRIENVCACLTLILFSN